MSEPEPEPTEQQAEGAEPAEATWSAEAAQPAEAVGPATTAVWSVEASQTAETVATAEGAEPAEPHPGRVHRARLAFRGWRRSRPFWGGLIVVLGAGEILITYQAPFGVLVHFGLYGLAGYLVPIVMGLLGLMVIFEPAHRTFYSVLAVLAALGTWLTSNLGGFFIGMLLGLVGGCLAFGWQYGERPERPARAEHTKRRRFRVRARAAE